MTGARCVAEMMMNQLNGSSDGQHGMRSGDSEADLVFKALSTSTRRAFLDALKNRPQRRRVSSAPAFRRSTAAP
jgi:hypothetical protein